MTTENIHNVKKDKMKRTIPFSALAGISLTMQGSKNEFVIHVKKKHDYRIQTACQFTRKDVVDLIKRNYADKYQTNLPIYHIECGNLKKFCTNESQAKRGVTMMPPSQFRNFYEDLIKEDGGKQSVYEADSQKNIRNNLIYIIMQDK